MGKFKTNQDYFAFSKKLIVIPTLDIIQLLSKYKIKLPIFVHAFLLKETVKQKVFDENIYNTFTDELKFRLRGYDNYSVYPIEKLINKKNLEFDLARYKELLFDFIFVNRNILKYKGSFLNELEQLQHNYTVDLEVMKYNEFYDMFKEILYSANGYLDGLKISEWNDDLLVSYTLGDLKELGKKYAVTIPRRINKGKFLEILKAKFNLTDDETVLLQKKSVLELEIYAKEKGFKISTDLKKKDMIEFLQFSLNMYHVDIEKDEFSYDVPLTTNEDKALEDIQEEIKEVVEETSIEEPEVVVVPEEEIEDQPIKIEETLTESNPIKEELIEEEATDEEVIEETPIEETVKETYEPQEEVIKDKTSSIEEKQEVKDKSLLSSEEKELLDEKINQIIKRYYKKRRRRRISWTIILILILLLIGTIGYSYYYYTTLNPGSLPFNLPVFWN